VPRDDQLLVGRNDEDFDGAVMGVDALACLIVRNGIDAQAEPGEPRTDRAADFLAVLADAAGEDQAVQSQQRGARPTSRTGRT
jgi:hypothetical protein